VEGNLKEEIDSLYVYIKSLKEIDRAIILLHLDSNNYQEISDILGLTITNVSTKLSRIRQQLKQHFKTKKLI
jgi:RNA polymerase sigma-70 factor (ECF subfamily)